MSTANRVIKNTGFLYVRTIVSLLLSVFTTRFLLKGLGVEDYGLYNVVGGAISMLGFINASMSSVTQRFISYAEGRGDKQHIIKIFNNSLLIHNALALITIGILFIAGIFFFNGILNIPEGKTTDALFVYGCLLFSTVFSITVVPYEAEINAHENMFVYAVTGVTDVVLKFLIACSILYLDTDKLVIFAVLMALEAFLIRFITQIYCKRTYAECRKIQIQKNYDKGLVKEMTSFSGWNLLNIGSGMISLFGMNVVVNHYFGVELNAAMGIATQLSGVMMGLSANMLKAVTPVIVKSEGGGQHKQMLHYSYMSCKFSYLIFSFICIPVLFFLQPILSFWLTDVPQWTAIMCIILILSTLAEQLTIALYQSIMAVGNINRYCIVKSTSNILPIIISIIMFQFFAFEPYWILINWGIFKGLIGSGVNLVFSKRLVGVSFAEFNNKVFFPIVLTSSLSALIYCGLSLFHFYWLCNLSLGMIIAIPIYFLFALDKMERNKIMSLILRKNDFFKQNICKP